MAQISKVESTPNNWLNSVKKRAALIVNLANNDSINYPTDGYNFSTNNTISIYQHVRVFSAAFSELNDNSSYSYDNRVNNVKNILLQIFEIQGKGLDILAKEHKLNKNEITQKTDKVDIFNIGLIAKYKSPEEQPNGHIYFFILALNSLLDFVDQYSSSFNTMLERESFSVREASYQQIIFSMGALFSAQYALEKGMNYQTFVVSKLKLNQLTEKVNSLNSEKIKVATQRKKGGKATAKKWDKLKEFIKVEGHAIWQNDTEKEQKIGYVSDTLQKDILHNPGKVNLNADQVPKINFFRNQLKEVAPRYATTGGRPKKNQ